MTRVRQVSTVISVRLIIKGDFASLLLSTLDRITMRASFDIHRDFRTALLIDGNRQLATNDTLRKA